MVSVGASSRRSAARPFSSRNGKGIDDALTTLPSSPMRAMSTPANPIAQTQLRQPASSPQVVIDLTNDPSWCHTVEMGLLEHAKRFLAAGRTAVGLKISTKLLVEPALLFCARFTGDEIIRATDDAFDIDQHKEGSVTVSRAFMNESIRPLARHFAETCSTGEKQRWGTRQVVLSCLFLYANHLVKNASRDTRLIE